MLQMLSWLISHDIIIGSSGFYEKSDTENVAYCSKIPIKGIDIYWLNVAIEYMEYIKQPPNDKCIYEIEYLTCRDAGLTSVPDQIPPNLEEVIISDNPHLTFIPDDKFKTQTELKKLILNNNSISHIPIGLPKSLIMLELRDNEIGNWNSRDLIALQNLTNLRQIYLENNNISVLYAYQFEGLTEMNWVGLSRNQLHCDCSLQSFVIWFNDIAPRDYKFVGPSFPECSSPVSQQGMDIRHLHGHFTYGVQCAPIRCEWKSNNRPILNCSRAFLNDDSINTYKPPYEEGIAPVIPENSYWTSLDLSGLMLKDDQIQYSHLTRLMSVNLSENSLTQIPLTGFGPSVQIMNLSRNFIEHLPSTQEFKKYFPKIKSLDLSKNRIKHLDFVEVGTLEFVDTLLLTGNPFICNCSLRTLVEWIHVNKENTQMVRQHQLAGQFDQELIHIHTSVGSPFLCPRINM
uniref:protein slit-like isoform X1 n=1 Tax=Styela clava TaxID=7725 RepID=UPI00193A6038|nr:protein slit-like isoform X1 [Styela clava]